MTASTDTTSKPATKVEAEAFAKEYLNLKPAFPEEAIENSVSEFVTVVMRVTEAAVRTTAEDDAFLYQSIAPSVGAKRQSPRYIKAIGLNQLQRVAAVMLLLRQRIASQAGELNTIRSAIMDLQTRAEMLADEGNKLTRWDFLLMAVFGKAFVIDRIRAKRENAGKPYLNLDGAH